MYLRLERLQLSMSRVQSRFRLIEFLLADNPRRVQSIDAIVLLLRILEVGFLRCTRILLALNRGLLLGRVNLHQRNTSCDLLARVHIDLRDHPFHLRHDYGRVARFQRGHIFGRVIHGDILGDGDLHRHGGRTLGLGIRALATTCADGNQEEQPGQ